MNTSLTTSITPQFRMIDGVKIRYADSGGSQEPTLLLTSPWPESVYAFAPMWEHAVGARPPVRRRSAGVRRLRAPR